MSPIITLTTDFGAGSHYVAQMKGVILQICPQSQIVDVAHGVAPQSIRGGAIVLTDVVPRFPQGTIHVAVVDPGVGTGRRIVAVRALGQTLIAPDNGILTPLLCSLQDDVLIADHSGNVEIRCVENRDLWQKNVSNTFHGRDIMAPVAAHLAGGVSFEQVGPSLEPKDLVQLPWPQPKVGPGIVDGEIIFVDSFGNLLSNITDKHLRAAGLLVGEDAPDGPPPIIIECLTQRVETISRTYGDHKSGVLVSLFDSAGRLEIAIVAGNAARELQAAVGAGVIV